MGYVKSFYIDFFLLTRFLFVDLFYFGGLFQGIERGIYFMDQYVRARIVCLFLCSTREQAPAQRVFLGRKNVGESKSKTNNFLGGCVYIFFKEQIDR